jgi:hypothetical protein
VWIADAGERLNRCIPTLSAAIDNWCASSLAAPAGSMTLAAATPKGGIVLSANGWPGSTRPTAAELERDAVACAVASGIESQTYQGDRIATVMLGRSGIAACEAEAAAMMKPLTIFLVEHEKSGSELVDHDGGDYAALIATVGLAAPPRFSNVRTYVLAWRAPPTIASIASGAGPILHAPVRRGSELRDQLRPDRQRRDE